MSATKFSELNIAQATTAFTGEKIKISKVLNREITILDYKIGPTKYPDKPNVHTECLHLSIKIGDEIRVVFTGSRNLCETIKKVPKDKLPIITTIQQNNERYEFT